MIEEYSNYQDYYNNADSKVEALSHLVTIKKECEHQIKKNQDEALRSIRFIESTQFYHGNKAFYEMVYDLRSVALSDPFIISQYDIRRKYDKVEGDFEMIFSSGVINEEEDLVKTTLETTFYYIHKSLDAHTILSTIEVLIHFILFRNFPDKLDSKSDIDSKIGLILGNGHIQNKNSILLKYKAIRDNYNSDIKARNAVVEWYYKTTGMEIDEGTIRYYLDEK